jgi:uncharacterized protein YndB with AHSA1/START domain
MWSVEHSVQVAAPPQAVWAAWRDVEHWPEWNADIEQIDLDGPFATGSTITMTPRGQGPVQLAITDAVENEQFVDEAQVADTTVRTTHRIEPGADGTVRVLYRLEATGPAAEQLGPAITADFPDTLAALASYVGG